MSLGPAEILVVLVLALIVFGPKRLPEVGRQVGGALRELRKVQTSVEQEIRSVLDDTTAPVRTMLDHTPDVPPEVLAGNERAAIEATTAPATESAVEPATEPATDAAPPVAVEPDLGDEHRATPVPDREPPDIDGLSGGTFS